MRKVRNVRTVGKLYGLILSLTGFAISINVLPALVTSLIQEFNISVNHLGFAFSLQYVSFFIFSLIYGFLIQKGRKTHESSIVISLLAAAAALCFLGYINSFFGLIMLLVIVGGSGGILESVSSTMISAYEKYNSSRFLNLSQFFYCIGAMLSPAITALLFTWNFSISYLGIILAVFIALIAVAVFILIYTNTGEKDTKKTAEVNVSQTTMQNVSDSPRGKFIWYLLAMFMFVVAESSLASWIPLFFEKGKQISLGSSALILTFFWLGVALGRLYYAFAKTKSLKKSMLIHGLIALLLAFSMNIIQSEVLSILCVFGIGLSCGPLWPMLLASCRHEFSKPHYIMYLVSTASIGAFTGPLCTSLLITAFDITHYFSIIGVYILLLIIFLANLITLKK
ncbi:MAG: MFS transporter [Bacteroidetes bacterium]|nr:MFS transporter [Bacteroidota bacterium]